MSALRLAEATPAEVAARLESRPILLMPVGTIEYHGAHLPLGLDGLKSESIAAAAADLTDAVLAPTSWWAADGVRRPFTLRLPANTIEPLLREALVQFACMGFQVVALVNGHFGLENSRLMRRVALSAMEETSATIVPLADYEVLLSLGDSGDHAGHWEASLLLGSRPDLVHLDAIPADGPVDGVIGADPRTATERDGRRGVAHAGGRIAVAIERALAFSPAERGAFLVALAAGLAALDVIASMRCELSRDQVPPVLTEAWSNHLAAMDRGDFLAARRFADEKRSDPFV